MFTSERITSVLKRGLRSSKGGRRARSLVGRAAGATIDALESRRLLAPLNANAGGPYVVNEGQTLTIDGGSSTDNGTIVAYGWDLNYQVSKGFRRSVTGQAFTLETDDGNATRTIALRVTDDDGNTDLQVTTVTVNDVPPTVMLVGNATAEQGQPYTLAWSSTDPGIDTISGYTVDWGDGTTPTAHAADVTAASHTYAADGNYVITFTATDEDGSHVTTKNLTVIDVPIILNASLVDATIDEGGEARVNFSAPNRVGAIDQWIVDWGDGTVNVRPSRVNFSAHTYADEGDYTITVTALETDGTATDKTLELNVANVAPTAVLGGVPAQAAEGTAITATKSGVTDAGLNDTLSYAWELKKGEAVIATSTTSGNYTFTPTDDGDYTLTLSVTDNDGASVIRSTLFTVTNVAPTVSVSATIPTPLNEGATVTFTANVTDPGADDTHEYSWSIKKDGEDWLLPEGTDSANATFDFTPDNEGIYVVSCLVTDDDGGQVAANSAMISVLNVAPAATISGTPTGSVDEGEEQAFTASASDAGVMDELSYAWTATRNGSAYAFDADVVTDEASLVFTPDDDGVYNVTCTITDGDGGTFAASSGSFTVDNVAPEASASGPTAGTEGAALTFEASATDAGSDTLSYAWSVTKDGVAYDTDAVTNASSLTFTPDDDGIYIATVAVADDESATVSASSAAAVVTNVAPEVSIADPAGTISENTAISVGTTVIDPGTADTMMYAWTATRNGEDFDLSGVATDEPGLTFTPADDGTYVLSVTVTDDDAGAHTTTKIVNVLNGDPLATITAEPAASITQGTTATYTISANDPSPDDLLSYEWQITREGEAFELPDDVVMTNATLAFTPTLTGAYEIAVTVTDDDDGTVTVTRTLTVTNVSPSSAAINGPTGIVAKNATVTFTGTATDPGEESLVYKWTVAKAGEVLVTQTSDTLEFVPTEAGTYEVYLNVSDGVADTDASFQTFTVNNNAPTVDSISGASGYEEMDSMTLGVSATDADDDALSYAWAVIRDGVTVGSGEGETFNFTAPLHGPYVATVIVSDGETTTTATQSFTVANVAPTATIAPISGAIEGAAYTMSGSGADIADSDLTFLWQIYRDGGSTPVWAGNSATPIASGATHTYSGFTPDTPGIYRVRLTVTDSGLASTSTEQTFVVANNVPSGTVVLPNRVGVIGWEQTFGLGETSYYADDVARVSWNFGDGTPVVSGQLMTADVKHRYYVAGTYTVTATFTDNDGGVTTSTKNFVVNDFGIQADPTGAGTVLVVMGSGANDVISFSQNTNGTIKAARNGVTLGSVFSVDRIYANGDSGANKIEANVNVTVPALFYGGSGRDTLVGGSGTDVLVGRRGIDNLNGGAGRDFLIGGVDSDVLVGGSGDDILVGGSHASSETAVQLNAIMNEWGNNNRTLTQRATRLRDGAVGLAAYFASGTVIGDAKIDTLAGGTESDWLWAEGGTNADSVSDAESIDRIETIAA